MQDVSSKVETVWKREIKLSLSFTLKNRKQQGFLYPAYFRSDSMAKASENSETYLVVSPVIRIYVYSSNLHTTERDGH
jgi:hypothetical protein